MKYSLHPAAEAELIHAVEYYEGCEPGLGHDFSIEIYSTIERITTRFPYGVLYAQENSHLFIVAIMHLHREPDYWKHRT